LENSPKNFTLYPLLWLAGCFAFGILSANFFGGSWQVYLAICFAFTILAAVFIKQKIVLVFLFVAFAVAGGLCFQIENQIVSPIRVKKIYDEKRIKSGDPIEVEGILQTKPELAVGGVFLILKTEKAIYKESEIKISGNVRLFASAQHEQTKGEYDQLDLNYGSRVRVACNLRREDNFLNAGVVSQTKLLDQKDIDATAIIKSPLLVEKIGDTNSFATLAWLYERRENLIIDFRDNFNVSTAGVLIASLLGNKYFLDKPTAEVFREGGTFHVLVISGLHITFIGGLMLLFVRFFTDKRLWQFMIAAAFLWAYSLAVGADVPVIRATIMFTILLFSQVVYRSGTLLNAFGACALILLVWHPNDIFTSSFQLTFASVGAIVAMAFPLIENLRAVGSWSPSAETPFPPDVSVGLKKLCETIYWREAIWEAEIKRHVWTVNIFKSPYLKWRKERNWQGVIRYLFEAVLVSAIAQAWLLPLTVIYFHRISIFGVLLNLWVEITIALESFAAIFAVFLAKISSSMALPFVKLTEVLNWILISVPNLLTENSWASVRLPVYSGAMKAIYLLYFLPLIVSTIFLNRWKPFSFGSTFKIQNSKLKIFAALSIIRISTILFLVFFTLIVFHPFSAPRADGRLRLDFLDVGQGDSALVTFPNGETLLVDGGGKMNFNQISVSKDAEEEPEIFAPDTQTIGETVVSNFLWAKGYSQIDYILATHADADHIQGLTDVAKNFRVRAAIFGRTPLKNSEFAGLFAILQKRGTEAVKLARGDVLTFGDVKVEILYPEKDENADAVSDNNHSLVLRVNYGARKFLLTGDIEKETEIELLKTPEFVQADVIKVAHHGSATSSTQKFIDASEAKLAIISVGRESPFGHPKPEVVERWKNAGAKILTTGENGTISVSTNGRDLQLTTFSKEKNFR